MTTCARISSRIALAAVLMFPTWARAAQSGRESSLVEHCLRLGTRYLLQGRHDLAAREFATAYLFDAQAAHLYQLGRVYYKAQRRSEAHVTFLWVLKLDSAGANLPESRWYVEELQNRSEAAQEDDAQRKQRAKTYAELSDQYFAGGQYDLSAAVGASAYAILPFPTLLYNLAQAHRRAGRTEEALLNLERLVREAPQNRMTGEARNLIRELRPVVRARHQPPAPVYRRAWFWAVLGGFAAIGVASATLAGTLGRRDEIPPLPNNIDL